MPAPDDFAAAMQRGYDLPDSCLHLGTAMHGDAPVPGTAVRLPLGMFNRHGLIAGATGTGKTKTLQVLAERLSFHGVPSLLMDMKGDLSGIAAPAATNEKLLARAAATGVAFAPAACPVELLTLTDAPGTRLRTTVTELGPVLFGKMLGLNDTQSGIASVVFQYCDDQGLPLIDLADFRTALNYVSGEAAEEVTKRYGRLSKASVGTIGRKLLELEQQGGGALFGQPSFEVADLCRTDADGRGVVSILRLADMQSRPKLFSTFMLGLLAELYASLPERGDADRPLLCVFIDEAHLVFDQASDALLNQIESIIKLIRSKGVGIFFCTQVPSDIPDAVLSQLGMKVQHALRAFTAKDRKNIRKVAENYPITDFYESDKLLTSMGIGEAMITLLNEKGIPTPLVHTLLCAPQSRMDVLIEKEIDQLVRSSQLVAKYNQEIDRESAYEILNKKLEAAAEDKEEVEEVKSATRRKEPSTLEVILKSSVTRTVVREVTRGILGVLGIRATRRRSTGRKR